MFTFNRSWIFVFLTCVFELMWLYGFQRAETLWHWVFVIACICLDLQFLARACRDLPTGTVYAIFAGIGTISTILMDVFLLDETISVEMIFFIFSILIGVIGINLFDDTEMNSNNDQEKGEME